MSLLNYYHVIYSNNSNNLRIAFLVDIPDEIMLRMASDNEYRFVGNLTSGVVLYLMIIVLFASVIIWILIRKRLKVRRKQRLIELDVFENRYK
jgi:hypothetical protein